MPEFSQLLRQRLASGELVEGHPDADTLTAYAEKLLPAPEQGQVLEHLARCRDCRDVVALTFDSIPAEPQTTAAAMPVRSGRLGWARLIGLSASFAAIVLVAILIVRQPHLAGPQQSFSQVKAPQPPVAAPSNASSVNDLAEKKESPSPFAAPEHAELARARASVPSAVTADRIQPRSSSAITTVVAGNKGLADGVAAESANRRDYFNENLFIPSQSEVVAVNEIPPSPAPRISAVPLSSVYQTNNNQSSYFANNQSSYFPGLPAPPTQTKTIQVWEPAPPSNRGTPLISAISREAKKIMRRNAPINPSALTSSAMVGGDQLNPALKAETVEVTGANAAVDTANGDLDHSPAFTRRALGRDAGAQTAWTVGSGKLLRTDKSGAWVAGYTGPESIDFSFVSANGLDVWAGGNRASVIHSRDGGSTWERVRLGDGAVGTVILISVLGSNIRVTTSENQTYASQDGGKTWTQN
jgi:hypothetical protein